MSRKRWRDLQIRRRMGLSGPEPNLILGNLIEFAATNVRKTNLMMVQEAH